MTTVLRNDSKPLAFHSCPNSWWIEVSQKLEDTARYAGLLLAPEEGFGLRPRTFFALQAKQNLFKSVLDLILVFFGDL